ncbi:MAG: murein transglycosylase A [Alphaproteobacteria bacterium]
MQQTSFDQLPGWRDDDLTAALPAWQASCTRLASLPPERPMGPEEIGGTVAAWADVCDAVLAADTSDANALRTLMEANLVPHAVRAGTETTGIFTGYFEPELHGTRTPDDVYKVPLYALPDDRVTVDLGDFDTDLDGRKLIGRIDGGKLVPYRARGEIDAGAIDDVATAIFWVEDPLDAFILHIQGSGVVILPDGSTTRVGYAGHNGYRYTSIGRWLMAQGELAPGTASFDNIRQWLTDNPDRAAGLLAVNQRYIFFREVAGAGPLGASGLVLTPGRSLAIDPAFLPLDVPLWLDAEHPLPDKGRLQRLMVAQDTGSAITGPIRGDVSGGTGRQALAVAGRMRSEGSYYLLLPRGLATRLAQR